MAYFLAIANFKADGVKYKPGQVYDGKHSAFLMDNGCLKVVDGEAGVELLADKPCQHQLPPAPKRRGRPPKAK